MQDGLVKGYLTGDGKTGPVGIMKKLESYTSSGTASDKAVKVDIKKFSPKGLAGVQLDSYIYCVTRRMKRNM